MAYIKAQYSVTHTIYVEVDDEMLEAAKASDDLDDIVNEVAKKFEECDGMVVGSPVYYASANGTLTAFLDRLFYSSAAKLAYKPAAAIVSCRRGGASATFEVLNKYFTIRKKHSQLI